MFSAKASASISASGPQSKASLSQPHGDKKLEIFIGSLKGNQAVFVPSNSIKVSFNPTEFTVEKGATYAEATIPGLDSPLLQFSSGKAKTLTLELLLDTYTYGKGEDIRSTYIEKFEKLVMVDGHLHAPPPCKVVWGTLEFIGMAESLSKKYVMFSDDGTPVRARINLKFKEYIPVDIQLKKTKRSSPDKRKYHTVAEGDSLWQLAYQAYGDPANWRILAEANHIDDPLDLGNMRKEKSSPGQVRPLGKLLTIPAFPPMGLKDVNHGRR